MIGAGWVVQPPIFVITATRVPIVLELGHHLASTGIDPALLYEAEVRVLLRQASAGDC